MALACTEYPQARRGRVDVGKLRVSLATLLMVMRIGLTLSTYFQNKLGYYDSKSGFKWHGQSVYPTSRSTLAPMSVVIPGSIHGILIFVAST